MARVGKPHSQIETLNRSNRSTESTSTSFESISSRTIIIRMRTYSRFFTFVENISSGLSSERIILSPFTKEFRGEGHSYESLNFSGATNVAISLIKYCDTPHGRNSSLGTIGGKYCGILQCLWYYYRY